MTPSTCDSYPFRSGDARQRYHARYEERSRAWPITCETRFVATEQGSTLVRTSGPPSAAPLVLLNGMWGDSLAWPPAMIERLSAVYRVHSVDNVFDFGLSVNARSETSADEYAAWLGQLLGALGPERKVNVLGCSLGAWIVAEYALRDPGRLAKAVWLSPGGVVLSPSSVRSLPGGPLSLACMVAPSLRTVATFLRWLMPDFARTRSAEFETFAADMALGLESFLPRPFARGTSRRLGDSELAGIGVPVLYIDGERERMHDPRAAVSRLSAVAPRIRTQVLPGAGHDVDWVQTDLLVDRIVDFLESPV